MTTTLTHRPTSAPVRSIRGVIAGIVGLLAVVLIMVVALLGRPTGGTANGVHGQHPSDCRPTAVVHC